MAARLGVLKQSFFSLRGQYGRRVIKANSTPANESTTLLIGDSMIKNIQGTRLGKAVGHRVVVKSFSGATTKAMKDYLKPN